MSTSDIQIDDDRAAMLAERFRDMARDEFYGVAPFYQMLALRIAEDRELLGIAANARPMQPPTNLLFAAVHYLLLGGVEHPLARFYRSISPVTPDATEDPWPLFRAFCMEHRERIADLVATRAVQTNEARRSSYLFPAFAAVARMGGGKPLALVEIGSSAGLNLQWDRYAYDYGTGRLWGAVDSPVRIRSELRGGIAPPFPETPVAIESRIGIDLEPVDLTDPDRALWLRALVWPDQVERFAILDAAIRVAQHDPPPLVAGDASELLPGILDNAPDDATLCVFETHAYYQFPPEMQRRFHEILDGTGARRDLYCLMAEWREARHPSLILTAYEGGTKREIVLAAGGNHGEWVEWKDSRAAGS